MTVWPLSGSPTGLPLGTSHSRTVPSLPADANLVPSGLNAHCEDVLGVARERFANGPAAGNVPQPHGLVAACGGNSGAVGAERHAHDEGGVANERLANGLPRSLAEGDAGIHQRVGGLPQRSGCGIAALGGKGKGESGIGLADVTRYRRSGERNGLVALSHSFFPLYPCDRSRGDRAATVSRTRLTIATRRRRRKRRCSRRSSPASSSLGLPWIGAARSVTFSRNSGAAGSHGASPVTSTYNGSVVNTPGCGQHRQRRIRTIRVKPSPWLHPSTTSPPATTNSSRSAPRLASQ